MAATACAALLTACVDTSHNAAAPSAQPTAQAAAPAAGGAAGKELRALAEQSSPNSAAYRIGPQDVLDISVFQVADLTRTVQVGDSGMINMPLIGEVRAGGQTAQSLERELVARYGKQYVRSPQISVSIKEFNSQRITLDGAFKKPGIFPYKGNISLLQAVASAENFDSSVADSSVIVFRTTNGVRTAAKFDLDAIREGKVADPRLEPGDVVVAATSDTKVMFNNVMKVVGPMTGFARLFY